MIKILENDFYKEIENKKILVDFYANWCGPCKMMAEVFEEIQDQIEIDILKVDVDKYLDVASNYNIFSIPTIYLFDNMKIVKSHTGYLNKNELLDFINEK